MSIYDRNLTITPRMFEHLYEVRELISDYYEKDESNYSEHQEKLKTLEDILKTTETLDDGYRPVWI
jgi:hypothetical protein